MEEIKRQAGEKEEEEKRETDKKEGESIADDKMKDAAGGLLTTPGWSKRGVVI